MAYPSHKITKHSKNYRSKVHQAGYSLEQAIALNENELENNLQKAFWIRCL